MFYNVFLNNPVNTCPHYTNTTEYEFVIIDLIILLLKIR